MFYTDSAVEMAYPDRNAQNNTNNTTAPPSTNVISFDDFLSALLSENLEQPSAPQAAAGYQHTIDQAPVYRTPTNRRKSMPGRKESITDFM